MGSQDAYIDLTAKEIANVLDYAKKISMDGPIKKVLEEMMSEIAGNKWRTEDSHPSILANRAVGEGILQAKYEMSQWFMKNGLKKISRKTQSSFKRFLDSTLGNYIKAVCKLMLTTLDKPDLDDALALFMAEQIVSLARYDPQKAIDEMSRLKLADKAETSTSWRRKKLQKTFRKALAIIKGRRFVNNKKTTPDEVCRVYEENQKLVDDIKKDAKKFRNPLIAYEKGNFSFLTSDEFKGIAENMRKQSEIAVDKTACKLGIKENHCRGLMKEGRKNRKINRIWEEYFKTIEKKPNKTNSIK